MAGAAGSRTAGAVTPEELRLEKWTEERAQVRREKREAESSCAARELTGARPVGLTGSSVGVSAPMTATPLLADRGLTGS